MAVIESLQSLLDQMNRTPRDRSKAQGDELVVAHPAERHGVFVRDGGWVDIASSTQVFGIGPSGAVMDLNVLDVRCSVSSIDAGSLWIRAGTIVIDGYVPDSGILHGELIARYLRDARVVVTRGSLREIQQARGNRKSDVVETPVCPGCPSLVSVPLSALLEPFPWSRPVERRLLDRFRAVLDRVRGGMR